MIKNTIRALIPSFVLQPLLSWYHLALAGLAALLYLFPSRDLIVIGVTGTKGKSSTIEYLNAIFEAAGHKTAIASTIRFKVAERSEPNLLRMTMAGRFRIQQFLAHARDARCTIALVEMTSEGARQHRHRFIQMDALIFTNLAPEHIESHGSLAAYIEAKVDIGRQLARSKKRPRILVANADDSVTSRFLALPVDVQALFSLEHAKPWATHDTGGTFHFKDTDVTIHFPGTFSLLNALAAATLADLLGTPLSAIVRGLDTLRAIPGRAETVDAGQDFHVVVDYAHTPDSLRAIYDAYEGHRRICVLGATGGGRDTWKRPVMGAVADEKCDMIILTNEDPYDEEPRSIVEAVASGITKHTPEIIMDRRLAIRRAVQVAQKGDAILVTGKGTDPCICGPRGTKVPWSDACIAHQELTQAGYSKSGTV